MALWPDIEPAAASKTCSGMPDASSAISSTFVECTPARASGCSARLVLADINASVGLDFSSMRSCLSSSSSWSVGGRSLIQRLTSANSASNNCALVGAVTITLHGYLVRMYQIISQDVVAVLPTPWPLRTDILRSPRATASMTSRCQASGRTFSTSCTNLTGFGRYSRINATNGFWRSASICAGVRPALSSAGSSGLSCLAGWGLVGLALNCGTP